MDDVEVPPREIQILETAEDIQERRDQVLGRYAAFKEATRVRRQHLEEARRYMYFKRDADELESWILEKLQTASDENFRDPTNLQASFFLAILNLRSEKRTDRVTPRNLHKL